LTITNNGVLKVESTYDYNAMNWLQTVTKVEYTEGGEKASIYTYNYDKNGNQTGMLIDGVVTVTYQYDNLNRLTKTTKEGKDYKNSYNAEGLRINKTDSEGTTIYMYESSKVVMELDADGNMLAKNVYGTNLLKRTIEDGTTLYYMYNGHSDVTALLDTEGNIVGSYYYDAWGNLLESSGEMKDRNSILYAGYQYDSETELYYLNARMYDPKVARFLQEDTYRGDAADPLSLNLYVYCVNNPLIYWDPTGHVPANVQIGDYEFSTGDVTDGITTVTEQEFFERTGYGKYFVSNGFLNYKLDDSMIIKGTDGKRRVKLRAFSEAIGIDDTISYWTDESGTMNVLIRPEMKYSSIKVIRIENKINIDAYVKFTGDADFVFPDSIGNVTYGEVAASGIVNNWTESFTNNQWYDFGGNSISVTTKLYGDSSNNKILKESKSSDKQQYLNIVINQIGVRGTSYQRNANITIGELACDFVAGDWSFYSWEVGSNSFIELYATSESGINKTQAQFARTAAHEFGHALGLGDAYGGGNMLFTRPEAKEKDEVPAFKNENGKITKGTIMRDIWDESTVVANDLEMVWEAWRTNKEQNYSTYSVSPYNQHTKSRVIRM